RGPRPTGNSAAFVNELRDWVGEQLGHIAKPDDIRFTDNLPKTRSGKIMRRLLKAIARGAEITQDVSTLENPAILDQLRGIDSPPASRAGAKGAARRAAKKPAAAAKRTSAAKKPAAAKRTSAAKNAASGRAPAAKARRATPRK